MIDYINYIDVILNSSNNMTWHNIKFTDTSIGIVTLRIHIVNVSNLCEPGLRHSWLWALSSTDCVRGEQQKVE